jgi:hypothetical protein
MNESRRFQTGKKWFRPALLLVVVLILVLSCSLGAPAATSTPVPTNTNTPTETLPPTDTPEQTATKKPTRKPTNIPTEVPKVTLGQFEQALRDIGFSSVVSSDGSLTIWTLDNSFENIYISNDGEVQMDVLNSVKTRLDHMEQRFQVMDSLFPADFMAQLREDNKAYARTVGAGVTGKASNPYGPVPGDFWKYVSAYYNVSDETIETYKVRFALYFQQWTCPSGYICTFPSFGNQQFSGQASFVFYEVAIWLNT